MGEKLNLAPVVRVACGTSKPESLRSSHSCTRVKGHTGPCALVPIVATTQWQPCQDEAVKLPVDAIILAWCGTWLSSPKRFATQIEADLFKNDNGVEAFLIVPDARPCLKK